MRQDTYERWKQLLGNTSESKEDAQRERLLRVVSFAASQREDLFLYTSTEKHIPQQQRNRPRIPSDMPRASAAEAAAKHLLLLLRLKLLLSPCSTAAGQRAARGAGRRLTSPSGREGAGRRIIEQETDDETTPDE